MNKKLDRRKKYTRMVLKDSLMELLKEKPISNVTVKEICERADINRSTFYTHYSDQYDLVEQIESELIHDMEKYLNSVNFDTDEEAKEMTERLLDYLASRADDCKTLLSYEGDSTFQRKVTSVAYRFILNEGMTAKNIDPSISEYISSFIVNGSIQMMKLWLYNNMDRSPKEMSQLINDFINKGLYGLNLK
ncbi:TetR/AcrR family transcriptional regulator [Allobacillus sp. GCM10007491]|uniref:TetR/AcrR family transcriptional regulator n=1 Tax=Allobacillus saliphilus TaxID=2912308 RepID=A0A941CSH8_9BACI|nr:TetR/AcrR family transcriptional regulator [Allobacillus saliphilus]MBR7553078.1 TetR/AcrR family transcriptional regulator [Allobacillus saliphilus]